MRTHCWRPLRGYVVRESLPYIGASFAAIITCYIFWPGFMSADSIYQLEQARFGRIDNAHPALMIYLWRILDKLYPGPGLLIVLHNSIFYFSFAYIVRQFVKSPRIAAGLILISTAFPPTLGLLGVAWKDVGMMSFFIAGCAFLLRADSTGCESGRKVALGLGVVFTFLGVASRWNAFPAALPMWIFAAALIARLYFSDSDRATFPARSFWLKTVAFLVIASISVGITIAVNNHGVKDSRLWAAVFTFDLLGGSRFAGVNLLPTYAYNVETSISQLELETIYDPRHINLSLPPFIDPPVLLRWYPQNEKEISEVLGAWLNLVRNHFGAYIRHRIEFAKVFFGVVGKQVFYPTHYGIDDNDLGLYFIDNKKTNLVMAYIHNASATIVYRTVFLYTVGAVLITFLLVMNRKHRAFLSMMAGSAILFITVNLVLLPAADLRYHSWSIAVVLLVSIIFIGQTLCRLRDAWFRRCLIRSKTTLRGKVKKNEVERPTVKCEILKAEKCV